MKPAARLDARILKRSVAIAGHRTSISLEEPFWQALKEIAAREDVSVAALIARLDGERGRIGLSSALRLHVLRSLQERR